MGCLDDCSLKDIIFYALALYGVFALASVTFGEIDISGMGPSEDPDSDTNRSGNVGDFEDHGSDIDQHIEIVELSANESIVISENEFQSSVSAEGPVVVKFVNEDVSYHNLTFSYGGKVVDVEPKSSVNVRFDPVALKYGGGSVVFVRSEDNPGMETEVEVLYD